MNKTKVLEMLADLWSDLGEGRDNPEDFVGFDQLQADVLALRDKVEEGN